ncbi:MAG TPA: hypothetical protein VN874_09000, partial [Myxococcales bacterium]|nr:hypothetical protein [Myxococcales bacterium]
MIGTENGEAYGEQGGRRRPGIAVRRFQRAPVEALDRAQSWVSTDEPPDVATFVEGFPMACNEEPPES